MKHLFCQMLKYQKYKREKSEFSRLSSQGTEQMREFYVAFRTMCVSKCLKRIDFVTVLEERVQPPL